jgi:transcriptional regulator
MRAYNADRCRCFACRVAHANATRAYRASGSWVSEYVPAIGTQRRLQALAVIGWTAARLAERLGTTPENVCQMRQPRPHATTRPARAAQIAALYEQLWDKPQTDEHARRCTTLALRVGYQSPLAWDNIDDPDEKPKGTRRPARRPDHEPADPIAVARAINGEPVPLNKAEAAEAIARLNQAGRSADEIATLLHTTKRRVQRHRAKERAA